MYGKEMQRLIFLLVHLHLSTPVFINYTERCPSDSLERVYRSSAICSIKQEYHCLYEDHMKLVEVCQKYKQLPQGNYPRYSSFGDDIYYEECPVETYQHGPAKSFEITNCLFNISKCASEGQVECSIGTARSDSTCRCDYKNGYAMFQSDCCSPSLFEDCTCYKKVCPLANQEMVPDYNCVDKCKLGYERKGGEFECTVQNVESQNGTAAKIIGKDNDTFLEDIRRNDIALTRAILYVALVFYIFHILIIICYGYLKGKWRPFKYKLIPYLVLSTTMLICLSCSLTFTEMKFTGKIIIFVCMCLLSGIFVLVVYIFWTHEIAPDRVVYNEEYDIRVYKLLTAASKGDVDELKRLKYEDYVDIDDVDYDLRSALHLAAVEGRTDFVDYLIRHDMCFPDSKDRWKRSAVNDVEWHMKYGNNQTKDEYNKILDMLKTNNTDSDSMGRKKKHFRETQAMELIKAAEKGDLSTIKRLKKMGMDMNLPNSAGRTALHAAAANGMIKVVKYLVKSCEVSPFMRWNSKRPIDIIKDQENMHIEDHQKDYTEIMAILQDHMDSLKANAQVDIEATTNMACHKLNDDQMIVGLLTSAARGDIKKMRSICETGFDINITDYDKRTVLHIAVSENQEHIVDFLLGKYNLEDQVRKAKDRWNVTPLEAARYTSMDEVYNVFLNHLPELVDTENDDYRTCVLLNAAANGDLKILENLHKKHVDMNLRDYDGRTAVHLAAANNRIETVKFLVEDAKVVVSIPDRNNRYPEDEATDEKIKTLLQESNKIQNKPTKLSSSDHTLTIVMKAASKGLLHTLSGDRYKHFNMDSVDYLKETPLHVAASKARLKDVSFLLEDRKVSPFVRNSFWKMPIDLVRDKIDFWTKKELFNKTYSREKKTGNRSRKEEFENVQHILEEAMRSACDESNTELDKNFQKHTEEEKIFLFLNKAYKGDIKSFKRYLSMDDSLLMKCNYDKRSALHLAVAERHRHLVEFILKQTKYKNNVEIKDRWDETPYDEALKCGDDEIINLFKQQTNVSLQ